MSRPLTWGLTTEQIKTQFPKARIFGSSIHFNNIRLQNFPGDCGSLLLLSANYAEEADVKQAVSFASASGFSKIFAIVVGDNSFGDYDKAITAFKKARFILVHQGKSNRNSHKDDYVFVKIIRNCKHKGY